MVGGAERVSLLGNGDAPNVKVQTLRPRGGQFLIQIGVTMKRLLIQKKRAVSACLLETLLPVLFLAGLAVASLATSTKHYGAEVYVPEPPAKPVDYAPWVRSSVCYNSSAALPVKGFTDLVGPCSAIPFTGHVSCDDPVVSLPRVMNTIPGVCMADLAALIAMADIDNFTSVRQVPDLDDFVLLQLGMRSVFGRLTSDRFLSTGSRTSLLLSGLVYVVPRNAETEAMVGRWNTSYSLFKHIFGGYFATRSEATDYLASIEGDGKAWAFIEVFSMSATGGLSFDLALNISSVPTTQQIRGRFGGDKTSYKRYFASGFLTLQKAVEDYYTTQVLNLPLNDTIAVVPMPLPDRKENTFLSVAGSMMPLVLVMAFLYFVSQLGKHLVEEKELRLREGMMIMGLGKASFFSSWLLVYTLENLTSSIVITALCKLFLLKQTDVFLTFVIFFLFGESAVMFASMASTVFGKSRTAALVIPLLYFVTAVPLFALQASATKNVKMLLSLLSPSAFSIATQLMFNYEIEQGAGWADATSGLDDINIATAMTMLAIDTFLYLLLTLYLDAVLPSEWGTNLHPLFCCFPWGKKRKDENDRRTASNNEERQGNALSTPADGCPDVDRDLVEEYPDADSLSTVHIHHLWKEFPTDTGTKKIAVNDLELRLFPNHVTVLLGHNGAGKTTTMNMLTGMLPMTRGDCTVYGSSVQQSLTEVRREIGFCPQHNILWPNLTCLEHLEYYAALKGVPASHCRKEALDMLDKVDLAEKRDVFSEKLSGGQKRKLSVGIAFIGGSRLVLLDEPTAGMDVGARRHTWDLIKQMSSGRTIVLTTHFMDEADLLGHRIAIMSKGRLYAYGSPLFLKSRLGTGYVLRVSRSAPSSTEEVNKLLHTITSFVPDAAVKERKGQEDSFTLPMHHVAQFPALLRELEANAATFNIIGISMSVSTLEDVFVQIAQKEEADGSTEVEETPVASLRASANSVGEMEKAVNPAFQTLDSCFAAATDKMPRGPAPSSFVRQLKGLVMKRFHNGKRDRRALCLQSFLPIICILFAMWLSTQKAPDIPRLVLDVDEMYGSERNELPIMRCDKLVPYFHRSLVCNSRPYTPTDGARNLSLYLLDGVSSHGGAERNIGVSCSDPTQSDVLANKTTTVAFVNTSATHAMPQVINEYSRARTRFLLGNPNLKVQVATFPMPYSTREQQRIDSIITVFVSFFILIPFTFIPSTYVSYIVKERTSKAKHLQFVSGVNFTAYWLSNYIFDLLSFAVTEALAFLIFALFNRTEYVGSEAIGCSIMLFTLYGISGIAFAYTVSFLFNNHSSAQNIIMLSNFLCGFVLVITAYILKQLDSTKSVADVLIFFFRIVPAYCLGEGIMEMAIAPTQRRLGVNVNLFDLDRTGWGMLYMGIEIVGFSVATLLIDHPARRLRQERLMHRADVVPPAIELEDVDVATERSQVEQGSGRAGDVVRVVHLCKVYDGKKVAVKNLSFGVPRSEVFGFLGTNGAGKTTTMSVLTGEFLPTHGRGFVAGHDVVEEAQESLRNIGYCPQFDALMDLMTAEEHLQLYAALRGIPPERTPAVIDALIEACNLTPHRKLPSKKLSGGNKRKLSVAISLIGNPTVVFLDEPSAGMDPLARRHLWDVIVHIAKKSCVVLTSHHLEEVEVLAHRVAIMVEGELKCIGSLDHLKRKFGRGYELSIKVGHEHESAEEQLMEGVKAFIAAQFPSASLVEQRAPRITFGLPHSSVALPQVFEELQRAKDEGKLGITDYTVQQSSLEQVFMRISEGDNTVGGAADAALLSQVPSNGPPPVAPAPSKLPSSFRRLRDLSFVLGNPPTDQKGREETGSVSSLNPLPPRPTTLPSSASRRYSPPHNHRVSTPFPPDGVDL